ncbi:MAG: hypothetical protein JJE17_10565 [Peptostreptococcaceae bacterium]|nr:hypothetical protein [Peptostreptococcaceae bacterium]
MKKVTLSVAKNFIDEWCKNFNKGNGNKKELPRDSFYYLNEKGGYSACDNTDGDCFCEDFETEIEAQRYLEGWSLGEIAFGERDN